MRFKIVGALLLTAGFTSLIYGGGFLSALGVFLCIWSNNILTKD